MSRSNKKKISTEGGEGFGSNAFGGLDALSGDLGKLPDAPIAQKLSSQVSKRKKPKSKGRVEVRREKAGRGGKTVTTLKEFPSNTPVRELETLILELKKTCACGGTLKGKVIELQGDVCDRVMKELEARNFRPVRSGG